MDYERLKGMGTAAIILVMIDRYTFEVFGLIALSIPPVVFCVLYIFADSAELQRALLVHIRDFTCTKQMFFIWYGIILNVVLVFLMYTCRRQYKKEIHRIATEKSQLQEQLSGRQKKSSGHKED